ncbi:MAG: HipA domain-containing protein [Betaproteobacteria bacterium]
MNHHRLLVFDGDAPVAAIDYDSLEERFSFEYDPQWLRTEGAYPLSPHLPLNGAQPASNTVRRFIENLLPEGRALDIVSVTHQVSKNNIFGLIRELGRETSGALTFLPEGEQPRSQAPYQREITRDELKRRFDERAQVPFSVWDGRVRMSIAGYQDKLAVYMDGDRMYLVENPLASTHKLKPEPVEARLPMLVANEHYCMCLAQRLGVPAARVAILRLPDPLLVVERFDRVSTTGRVQRLHIIDTCQTLDLPVSYKYERNFGSGADVRHIRDGVSFEHLFSVARHTTRKAVTLQMLARWAIFQYLIGNTDAHGKNVSFFTRAEGLALAPFYDMVSVVQYDQLDHELAMAYGDEFKLEDVSSFALADFAKRTGLERGFLSREMTRMARAAVQAAPLQADEPYYEGAERHFVHRIAAFVRAQADNLQEMANRMRKAGSALL